MKLRGSNAIKLYHYISVGLGYVAVDYIGMKLFPRKQ